jgi:gamma-glutamylcyclotransferase (GGCT)/AIG2-like uncharacterized protein YtfP
MSDGTIRYLFVYGTLMSRSGGASIGGAERRALHAASRSLGDASVAGRLHDLGSYPALVPAAEAGERCWGEVLALDDPSALLALLDPYEGIDPARPEAGDYRRVVCPVRLADGTELAAWVYIYQGDVAGCAVIPGGRWSA